MSAKLIVLGAGYGGLLAALRLARLTRHLGASVTLVDQAAVAPDRVRLHEALVRDVPSRRLADLVRGSDVILQQGRVEALDPDRRALSIATAEGPRRLRYDRLIYALGSFTDRDVIPGIREHAHTLAPATSAQVRSRIRELAATQGRVLVCGGGLSGIEVASEIAEACPELQVTLATASQIGPGLSQRARAHIAAVLSRLHVSVREQTRIRALEVGTAQTATERLPFDLCLWTGPFAVPHIARQAGLAVDPGGRILVDDQLRSLSHPEVSVVGDAAALGGAVHRHVRPACASATAMGSYAANALAADLSGHGSPPFRLGYLSKNVSLGRHEAVTDWVRPDDHPRERIWTGWPAVWWKSLVITAVGVWGQIQAERWWSGTYQLARWVDTPDLGHNSGVHGSFTRPDRV